MSAVEQMSADKGGLKQSLNQYLAKSDHLESVVERQGKKIGSLLRKISELERNSTSNLATVKARDVMMRLLRGETGMRLMIWRSGMKRDMSNRFRKMKDTLEAQVHSLETQVKELNSNLEASSSTLVDAREVHWDLILYCNSSNGSLRFLLIRKS